MSIFKKASVAPIVKTVISQGLDDYYHTDPNMEDVELRREIDESWGTPSSQEKLQQLMRNLRQDEEYDLADFVASMVQKGYDFQQVRDMLASVRSFLRP
jgi:hypothetical protein